MEAPNYWNFETNLDSKVLRTPEPKDLTMDGLLKEGDNTDQMQMARGETGMGCNSNSKIKSRYRTAIEPSRHRVKEKSGKRRQAVKRTSSRGHQTAHLLSSREHIEYGLGGWIDTLMDYWKDAKMEGRRCEWKED